MPHARLTFAMVGLAACFGAELAVAKAVRARRALGTALGAARLSSRIRVSTPRSFPTIGA